MLWQDYQRPPHEHPRGMTRLVDRIDWTIADNLRKSKRLSRKEACTIIGVKCWHTWKWRGWVPRWAIMRLRRASCRKNPLLEISHTSIQYWNHKELKLGQTYVLRVKETSVRIARKAAYMFAQRHSYSISTRLSRKGGPWLYVTRVETKN